MENLLAIVRAATECVQSGRVDEAMSHLRMLESALVMRQPVGKVDLVPLLNLCVGYLDVPLPLGAPLFAS